MVCHEHFLYRNLPRKQKRLLLAEALRGLKLEVGLVTMPDAVAASSI
jgi:hypothetical protein